MNDNNNYWRPADIGCVLFLLLIITAETTIFLLILVYFLFF